MIINIDSTSLVTIAATVFCKATLTSGMHQYQVEREVPIFASVNTHVFLRFEEYNSVSFHCTAFKRKSLESSVARLSSTGGRFLKMFLVRTQASKEYVFFLIIPKYYRK